MPTDAAGNWHPADGWPAFRAMFDAVVPPESIPASHRLWSVCETVGCPPQEVFEEYCRLYGDPKCGRVENWPAYMTPGEWSSLASFAERDVAARAKAAGRT